MPDPLHLQKAGRTVGRVDTIDDESVLITTPNGQQQRLWTTNETRVQRCVAGRRKDVCTGARVIVRNHPDRVAEATEIIVLPKNSAYGMPVIAAAPDSVTLKGLGGKLTTVSTKRAMIDLVADGEWEDVFEGAAVFARVALGEGGEVVGAYEIIVLPDDTTYCR